MTNAQSKHQVEEVPPSMISGLLPKSRFEFKDRTDDVAASTIYLRQDADRPIGLNVTVYENMVWEPLVEEDVKAAWRETKLTSVEPTYVFRRHGDSYIVRKQLRRPNADPSYEVADLYMRSRSGFALASAVRALEELEHSRKQATILEIAASISERQLSNVINAAARRDLTQGARASIILYNSPRIASLHLACIGKHIARFDADRYWTRMHNTALSMPIRLPRVLEDEVSRVVAQSDDGGVSEGWLKKAFKGTGRALKKFATAGAAGRIIIYVALGYIASRLIGKLPWWAIVVCLTCADMGWVGLMGRELLDAVSQAEGGEVEPYFDTKTAEFVAWQQAYAKDYCEDVQPHALGSRVVFPQSGLPTTALALGITHLVGRKVPLYSKIVNAQKFRTGVQDLVSGAEGAFEGLVNLVLKAFGSKKVFQLHKDQTVTKKFMNSVDTFDVEVRAKGRELDEDAFQHFAGLVAHGEEALTHWPRDSDEWRGVKRAMGVLTKLSCDYPAHFNNAKARVEPLGIMLSGDPGLGKTSLVRLIARLIAGFERPDEPYSMSKHTFQKPTGPYYEGYRGQLVFCMDDVFTKQAVAGEADSDAESVVKIINQWPLALNMANCALKGRFYMTSPYVVATSNLKSLEGLKKAVVDPQAIVRRFPLWYRVELRPGATVTAGCDPDETWDFIEQDFKQHDSCAPRINFSQLMTKIFIERRRRIEYHNTTIASEQYCDDLLSKLRPAVVQAEAGIVNGTGRFVKRCAKLAAAGLVTAKLATVAVRGALGAAKRRLIAEVPHCLSTIKHITGRALLQFIVLAGLVYVGVKAALAAVRGLQSVVGKLLSPREDPDRMVYKYTKHADGTLVYDTIPTRAGDARVVAESSARDEVLELVLRNMFRVFCEGKKLGYAFALDDMTLAMPAHFLEVAEHKGERLSVIGRRGVEIGLSPAHLAKVDHARDLCYFKVKTHCKDVSRAHVSNAPSEKQLLLVRFEGATPCRTTLEPKSVEYAASNGIAPVRRMMHVHTADTRYGDCGAIVMGATGKSGRRIFGMHTARDHGERPYSGCYTAFGSSVVAQSGGDDPTFCGHQLLATLEKPVHNGGDTRLEATPYAGALGPVETAPSIKRPVDGVDPMLKAISGYKREWVKDIPEDVSRCTSAVVSEIFEALRGHDLSPVDCWTAAAGIAGEPYCKGLARGKSPGYPFIGKYKDKKRMLGEEGPYVKGPAYDELEKAVDDLASAYGIGGTTAVYRDSLKDEPRSLEKIAQVKTRMISGCPVHLAVLGRMQTLRFTAALMKTRHEHGIMPGFNPFSIEASQLYHRLAFVNKDGHVTAGDYKEFDKTQHPKIMKMIWDEVSAYLVDAGCDPVILAGLGRDTFSAVHLGGNCYGSDKLYRVDGTLPSGHWMTSFLNSIYNAVILRFCWCRYRPGRLSAWVFRDHVSAVYYGDDFLMAVDDENRGFDLSVLQKHVQELGMVMTDEEGNYGGAGSKHITEVSFLCRTFRVDDAGCVWMPLQVGSLNDMFNWKKRSTTVEEHSEAITRAALMEAAAHELDTFELYYNAVQQHLRPFVHRMPELQLGLKAAYAHWRDAHREHVPVWTPDEE